MGYIAIGYVFFGARVRDSPTDCDLPGGVIKRLVQHVPRQSSYFVDAPA
jgi:hypothetical protein